MSLAVRILVADDDPAVPEMLRNLLQQRPAATSSLVMVEGAASERGSGASGVGSLTALPLSRLRGSGPVYAVTGVSADSSATAAVDQGLSDGQPYQLAFIDQRSTGLGGIELAGRIRQADANILLVLMTDQEACPDEIALLVPPADRLFCLPKPLYGPGVRQLVRSLTAQWRIEREYEGTLGTIEMVNEAYLEAMARTEAQNLKLGRQKRALKEQSALLKNTLDHMDQGILMFDADGIVQVHNRRVAELLDIPEEFLASKPQFAEIRGVQPGPIGILPEPLLSGPTDQERNSSYERRRPNGTVIEIHTEPLPQGGAVRTYTDVTARKAAEYAMQTELRERRRLEATLRQSQARFRDFAEAASDWLWETDQNLRFVYFSERFSEITGITQSEILGRTRQELVEEQGCEVRRSDWEQHRSCLGEHRPFRDFRYSLRLRSGQVLYFRISGRPLSDETGAFVGYRGTGSEITAEVEAENRLRLTERALEATAQGVLMVSIRPDHRHEVIYANPACTRLLGRRPSDLERNGEDLLSLLGIESEAADGLLSAFDGDLAYASRHRLRRPDGSSLHVDLTVSPVQVRLDAKEAVVVISDVTERVQLEAQLQRSQKMEAIGQLTGGLAHDFNNLLTVILGNAEILSGELADSGDLGELAGIIQIAAERGADLTQRLLSFARKQTLLPHVYDLNQVVEDLEPLLQRTIGEQIHLRTELEPDLDYALVDRSMLDNALLNLVVNARDAMAEGGTLTISTRPRVVGEKDDAAGLPPGRYIELAVSDTGVGIPPEVLPRVLEPFFTTKDAGRGSGLGLSMVYGFATQSGGTVLIESSPGEGTCIRLLLPASLEDMDEFRTEWSDECTGGGNETILVVEDQEEVRSYVVRQLKTLGYRVFDTGSTGEALEILKANPGIDLLFSDVVLAESMTGLGLARAAQDIRPGLRVLFMSGYSEEVVERHHADSRHLRLIRKPFRRAELAREVRKALAADMSVSA